MQFFQFQTILLNCIISMMYLKIVTCIIEIRVEAPVLTGRLRALLEHLASPSPPGTGSRRSRIQGGWSSKPLQRFSLDPESSADTREQLSGPLTAMLLPMPPGRRSHHGSVATSVGCRTLSTTSYPTGRRINSRPTG
jgi:hypothetical protein